jgi:pimeloyl-ACP methyl ester carboxylesterase
MRPLGLFVTLLGGFLLERPALADEFDSKGVKIHYLEGGKGEPVLLVHGLMSSAALNWQLPGTIDLLTPPFRVIAPDCRGHGLSGKPTEDSQYGVEMVEDLTRLLDHLKIEKAHLVGYSMGGMISMKFLVLHPERARSLVLGGMGWLKSGSPLEQFWEKTPPREENRSLAACMRGLSKLGVTEEEIKAVKVPVSVIVGDRDPCRKLYVDPLLRLRPEWSLTTVEGAGHFNCILKEEFKEAVKARLDAQAGQK